MKGLSILLLMSFLAACTQNKKDNVESRMTVKKTEKAISEKLNDYFSGFEIEPSIIVNNTEGNQATVQLAKHRVKWLDKEDETKIKIDEDLFSLKDKTTLNIVWDGKDSVDFANNWDEIKLYKFNEREIIGIRMSYTPCTGLGCSVDYFLVYDVSTKTKNFFGTFRTDDKLALYNFGTDYRLKYISKTYSGDPKGITSISHLYKLYSMNDNGQFVEQNDSSGAAYQLTLRMSPDDTAGADTLEQHWITQIK